MKTLAFSILLLSLLWAGPTGAQVKPSPKDSVHATVPSMDSVFAILRAYGEKRVSASVAAKVIVDYLAGTHKALNIQMDAALREAVELERKKRGGQ